jgi:hypothetical protein
MPRSIIRTITTAIAIAALVAPSALARPADTPPAVAKAAAAAKRTQDARSADADGFPTRPVIDRPSAPPTARAEVTPQPVRDVTPQPAADDGIAWTTIAIGIAGGLLAIGAIAGITTRTRRTARTRITA